MEFSIKSGSPEKQRSACVVVGVYEPRKLTLAAELIDKASGGYISDIVRRGDMEGHLGNTLLLHKVPNTLCDRVLLVGLGKERDFREKEYRTSMANAVRTLNETGAFDGVLYLPELAVKRRDIAWRIRHAIMVALDVTYRFDALKSKKNGVRRPLRKLTLTVSRRNELTAGETALAEGMAIGEGTALARDLGNLPSNICTPTYLADKARELAKTLALGCEILELTDIEKLAMGALLSVTKGTVEAPKFIVLEHTGSDPKQAPVVLVGKGITFDTGGISLKPAAEMDEMKFDMCGAASVFGALHACARLGLSQRVIGIIPACENMPSGSATKPGDVVTSMSGQTVEILNTDAEGRLILCDALTYAERYDPSVVIDIATLTGACVIALGNVAYGLYSNDDGLARDLLTAGEDGFDRGWQMPLWDEYQDQLKSNFADMANIGGRPAGSVTAACFLARYARKFDWAHLDIAGVAWRTGRDKGATGRPVPMLMHYLLSRSKKR